MATRPTKAAEGQAQPDPVSAPFTEDELATIRDLRLKLRKSNLGPEQLAAEVLASRKKHERHHRQSRKSLWERMGAAYTAVASAIARDEVDDLLHAMGVEDSKGPRSGPDLIRQVLDYGGELPPDMRSKRAGAIRWALRSGCEPADAPAFFKRERGITGCNRKWSEANKREPALKAAAASQAGAETGRGRERSIAAAKPATENGAAGSVVTPTPEGAGTAPVAQDRPVAMLTYAAVEAYKNIRRKRQAGILQARLWSDSEQLFVRTLKWTSKMRKAPSRTRATRPEARG